LRSVSFGYRKIRTWQTDAGEGMGGAPACQAFVSNPKMLPFPQQ